MNGATFPALTSKLFSVSKKIEQVTFILTNHRNMLRVSLISNVKFCNKQPISEFIFDT